MRKVLEKTIPLPKQGERENRDAGKMFVLTEMPASQGEKWAMRAFMALARSGIDIPEGIVSLGMIGVAMVGFQAFRNASFADVEPLMDEMMTCIKIAPSPENRSIVRGLVENDIEEVKTRFDLRQHILELHAGFTLAELASMMASPAKPKRPRRKSSDTRTSPL